MSEEKTTVSEDIINETQKQLTDEEIAKLREESVSKLNKEIEYLEVRYRFERLLADIEIAQLERTKAFQERAYIIYQQKKAAEEEKEEKPDIDPDKLRIGQSRKLKTN